MVYIHKQYDKISDHNELDTFVVTLFSNVPGLKISFNSLNGQYLQTTLSTIFINKTNHIKLAIYTIINKSIRSATYSSNLYIN